VPAVFEIISNQGCRGNGRPKHQGTWLSGLFWPAEETTKDGTVAEAFDYLIQERRKQQKLNRYGPGGRVLAVEARRADGAIIFQSMRSTRSPGASPGHGPDVFRVKALAAGNILPIRRGHPRSTTPATAMIRTDHVLLHRRRRRVSTSTKAFGPDFPELQGRFADLRVEFDWRWAKRIFGPYSSPSRKNATHQGSTWGAGLRNRKGLKAEFNRGLPIAIAGPSPFAVMVKRSRPGKQSARRRAFIHPRESPR